VDSYSCVFLKFFWLKYFFYHNCNFYKPWCLFNCAFSFYTLVFSLKGIDVVLLHCLITGHYDSRFKFLTLNSVTLQTQQTEVVVNKNITTYSYDTECESQTSCE